MPENGRWDLIRRLDGLNKMIFTTKSKIHLGWKYPYSFRYVQICLSFVCATFL